MVIYIFMIIACLILSSQSLCMEAKKCDVPTTPFVEWDNTPESLFNLATKSLGDNKILLPLLSDSKKRERIPDDVITRIIQWYFLHPDSSAFHIDLYDWNQQQCDTNPNYCNIFDHNFIEDFLKKKLNDVRTVNSNAGLGAICDDIEDQIEDGPILVEAACLKEEDKQQKIEKMLTMKYYNPLYAMIKLSSMKPFLIYPHSPENWKSEDITPARLQQLIELGGYRWLKGNVYKIIISSALKYPERLNILLKYASSETVKNNCLDIAVLFSRRWEWFVSLKSLKALYESGAHISDNRSIMSILEKMYTHRSYIEGQPTWNRPENYIGQLQALDELQPFLENNLEGNRIEKTDEKHIEKTISPGKIDIVVKNRLLQQGFKLSANAKQRLRDNLVGGCSIFPRSKYTADYLRHLYDCVLDVQSEVSASKCSDNPVVDFRPIEYAVLKKNQETIFQRNGGKLLLLTGAVTAATVFKKKECTII